MAEKPWKTYSEPPRLEIDPEWDGEALQRAFDEWTGKQLDAYGYWFDHWAADAACEFYAKDLRHTKGRFAGSAFELEQWQRNIIRTAYGWKNTAGHRKYRCVFVFIARKNGKSTIAAGCALHMLFEDGEHGAEVYGAAGDLTQASIVFNQAKQMTAASETLSQRARVYKASITYDETLSVYRVVSSAAGSKHGFNPHCVVFDELHVQKNRDLWDAFDSAMGARDQPMMWVLTTAGSDRESICFEIYDYACKVRDGIIEDETFLPVIYEADPEDDWRDEATWEKANPNIDVSVSREYLRQQCRKAQHQATAENAFKRLHLNLWTEQDVRWLRMTRWDSCAGPVRKKETLGHCYVGIDKSSNTDLTAMVGVFPIHEHNVPVRYHVRCKFWLPGENAERRQKRDRVPYPVWIRRGFMEATKGDVIDDTAMKNALLEWRDEFEIRDVAVDPWNSTQLQVDLAAEGFEVVQFYQSFKAMNEPAKYLERMILQRRIEHRNHPVLRWCASNVAVEMDSSENIRPSKKKSNERIDGVVALVMALGRAMLHEEDESDDPLIYG